jgi:hypothetical protein
VAVDSRLRGNDRCIERDPIPNDTTTATIYRIIGSPFFTKLANSYGTENMQIAIRSKAARWLLVGAEVAMLVVLIVWVGKFWVADMLANKPTAGNLERAVKLDPSNADLHMRLGGLYEYSPADMQLGRQRRIFAAPQILIPTTLNLGWIWGPRCSFRAR